MTTGKPTVSDLVTAWAPQPLIIVVAVALLGAYAAGLRRVKRSGGTFPPGRVAAFAVGLLLLVWTGCGFPAAYQDALFWVWTSRVLVLWLLVPIVVLSGQPVQLARAGRAGPRIDRVMRSRPARIVANPLVGPALVPVLSAVLFFGPLAGWSIGVPPAGWLLDLALLMIGALMVLPLVGLDEDASSLAVGLSLALGSFELVLDALPGIVLRLHTTLTTTWFGHRDVLPWSPQPLHDQQIAGAILWCVAEVIDLPFLVLVYRRWLRADERDAARVDAVLEAERAARRALAPSTAGADAAGDARGETAPVERDAPWWESDPAMRERLRRQG